MISMMTQSEITKFKSSCQKNIPKLIIGTNLNLSVTKFFFRKERMKMCMCTTEAGALK